ncbi:hypothetical protein [Archangium lansingense]|uniref:Transcriptional regulator n=1 Tax=Archangium lansingense TaxID=2995310 RepID=A0ABT3ZWU1_9BACT|nr:hypothetical protein [Archangium lansinium]MCY1073534.1 hypothetical protein [Archangium lansinium]
MRAGDLPEEVRRFITDHIDSVEQLEILLLLHQHPERSWTAESVARELRISALSADDRLKDMARSGILAKVQGSEVEYRYAPSQQLGDVVAGLATAYAERRVTVINLIFSKPIDKIRTFADAFRLRRDDDDNG